MLRLGVTIGFQPRLVQAFFLLAGGPILLNISRYLRLKKSTEPVKDAQLVASCVQAWRFEYGRW